MNTAEFEQMINKYYDDELTKGEEAFLFSLLAENYEAREYFKEMNQLKILLNDAHEELPEETELRIFNSIKSNENKQSRKNFIKKIVPGFSYASSIILLVVSLFLFFKMKDYDYKVENLAEAVKTHNETIEILLNSLPPVQVQSVRENKVVVYAN